ncbi:MAG: sensor domain-containing diguanylate cyclase [Candidatus Mariimomonas ferrooxydans]
MERLGEKIIHELIDKGVPIRLSALSGDKRFDEIISRTNVKVNNLLAVPLIIKGEILGSLILVNKTDSDEYLMTDEDMAMTVAFQAATVIEKSMLYEEIVQLSKTDGLTGLKNHRTFQEDLENEIKRARRLNKNFALLLIDIDYFKGLNDTYGHQEGDIVLKELSGIFFKNVRNIDSVSRYGGEEFTIILPEATYDGGMRVAEKIRKDVSEHVFNPGGSRGKLTVSIGVSTFPEDAIYREGLIKAADDALYMSKRWAETKL